MVNLPCDAIVYVPGPVSFFGVEHAVLLWLPLHAGARVVEMRLLLGIVYLPEASIIRRVDCQLKGSHRIPSLDGRQLIAEQVILRVVLLLTRDKQWLALLLSSKWTLVRAAVLEGRYLVLAVVGNA